MLCRHCRRKKVNRPRGLCWPCYYTPGVREKYPSTSKYARRGVCDFDDRPAVAARPTEAAPGTPGKVAEMEDRARLGQSLWHPLDAQTDMA
jgi:hypothetical protein